MCDHPMSGAPPSRRTPHILSYLRADGARSSIDHIMTGGQCSPRHGRDSWSLFSALRGRCLHGCARHPVDACRPGPAAVVQRCAAPGRARDRIGGESASRFAPPPPYGCASLKNPKSSFANRAACSNCTRWKQRPKTCISERSIHSSKVSEFRVAARHRLDPVLARPREHRGEGLLHGGRPPWRGNSVSDRNRRSPRCIPVYIMLFQLQFT